MCSDCMSVRPMSDIHVIPWWNQSAQDFVTTYRCGQCWRKSLAETRSLIKNLDLDKRDKFCQFLDRHGCAALADPARTASMEGAGKFFDEVLNVMESGGLRLEP